MSWYFRNHKAYVGVDFGGSHEVFKTKNSTFHFMSINEYIDTLWKPDQIGNYFAICNYVPISDKSKIRSTFEHLWCFYPKRGDDPKLEAAEEFLFGAKRDVYNQSVK